MLRRSLIYICVLALTSCSIINDYNKPQLDLPQNWSAEYPWHMAEPKDHLSKGLWWEIFNDDELNRLEKLALEQNPSLKIAENRITQAKAVVTISKANLYPEANILSNFDRGIISQNRPTYQKSNSPVTTSQNDFSLGLSVNYEVDLFGRVQNSFKAAKAGQASIEADYENIKLLLAAEIASDYFALRVLDSETKLVEKNIVFQNKALEFVKNRYTLGLVDAIILAQQQNQLDGSLAQLDTLKKQRMQIEHALALLTGSFANNFHVESHIFSNSLPDIPTILPSDVLQKRPDVASAERSMEQANLQISIAKAAFYPSINLSPNIGFESSALSTLANSSSVLWSLGVSATQPLFNAGKIKANVKISEITYQSSIESYRQTVLGAMKEVEDGLTGNILLNQSAEHINQSVESAKHVLELTQARYEGGIDNYLDVINAEQAVLFYERQAIQNKGQQFQVSIFLIKALGGSW